MKYTNEQIRTAFGIVIAGFGTFISGGGSIGLLQTTKLAMAWSPAMTTQLIVLGAGLGIILLGLWIMGAFQRKQ